ncbi:carboxypeptidase-like regulatory domain-containing protein [Natronospora cellulosivora (SeqCode)]
MKKRFIFFLLVILFLSLLTGCDNGSTVVSERGTIEGIVSIDDVPIEGVNVSIKGTENSVKTNSSGYYHFEDLTQGVYELFYENDVPYIYQLRNVVISGGKSVRQDMEISTMQDIEDMKNFIENLKDHGVNLMDVGNDQIEKIKDNFDNEIVPTIGEIGTRLGYIQSGFVLWNLLMYSEDEPLVGDFTVSLNYDIYGHEQLVIHYSDPIDNYQDLSEWKWTIRPYGTDEIIEIEMTNFENFFWPEEEEDVIIDEEHYDFYDKTLLDLSDVVFKYNHQIVNNPDFNWSFDFTLDSESYEEIEMINEYTYFYDDYYDGEVIEEIERYRHDLYLTLPRLGEISAVGIIEDYFIISDSGFEITDQKTTISFDAKLSFDLDNNNSIGFDGFFDAGQFNYSGGLDIVFASFPSFHKIFDLEEFPLIDYYQSHGMFSSSAFSIEGSTEVEFVPKNVIIDGNEITVPLPELIKYKGLYEDLTDEGGIIYNGSLEIKSGITNFDINKEKNENNYMPVTISVDGSLRNMDYYQAGDVTLNMNLFREYDKITTTFSYNFSEGKYIVGKLLLENNELQLTAHNEQYLKIELGVYDEENKIGEISNYDGTDKFGLIVFNDSGVPEVIFLDSSTVSLLP